MLSVGAGVLDASASCGSTDACITARASPSSPSPGGPSRSLSSGCSVITDKSSHSPLCWGSRPPASATSHRIDQEEFWGRPGFLDFEAAAAALRGWETRYNYERFSLTLQGRTPAEKLAALQPPRRVA